MTLAGAEAVVADGIAAADDPCDGAGREDVETDQLTEVTERAESSTTRMAPATKAISTVGRGLMNSSTRCLVVHLGWLLGRTLAGERGLHVLNLPSGSQSLEPLRPSKSVLLYSHLSLTTSGCCRAPTSPAGAPFGLAGPFRGIG